MNADTNVIRNPNEPNPPAVMVNGKIEKVDADLVQISLGTDQGVNKNNTLDVNLLYTNAGQETASSDPRQFQFAMKFYW